LFTKSINNRLDRGAIICKMSETINLARSIKEQLPEDIIKFIKKAGEAAQKRQQRLYMVGGVVRDLLLERGNCDLDLVVEGDAIKLAEELAEGIKAKATAHPRFGTATLRWSGRSADLASARAETYTRPGALPTIKPGTISDDLSRRDFTINAMAIELNPKRFGDIIDPHGGRQDIDSKLVRVMHDRSFIDDATRIWRALRYEQRLDFKLESATGELLKQCTAWLGTVSGDRIRHELELVLREEQPEKALRRADELGVLDRIHPSLKCDEWLAETFTLARERCLPDGSPNSQLYIALMCYRLTREEVEKVIAYLRLPKTTGQLVKETLAIKEKTKELSTPGLAPSQIYELVHGYSMTALAANSLAIGSETAAEHIELYLNVLRHVNPAIHGEGLKRMGIPEGPRMKQILHLLRQARLDGRVTSRKEEMEMVNNLMAGS
jgi:tRNA nucleotidyltransferase (CCA-adding enzyme)